MSREGVQDLGMSTVGGQDLEMSRVGGQDPASAVPWFATGEEGGQIGEDTCHQIYYKLSSQIYSQVWTGERWASLKLEKSKMKLQIKLVSHLIPY